MRHLFEMCSTIKVKIYFYTGGPLGTMPVTLPDQMGHIVRGCRRLQMAIKC